MTPYRRSLEPTRDDYHYVKMGRLNELNGPSSYPFPTLQAATRFAQAHKSSAPSRRVEIHYPDGRVWNGKGWVE